MGVPVSVRRDGLGCLPLLALSCGGLFVSSVLLEGRVDPAWRGLFALASAALPLLYFWNPRRPEESVLRSTSRAARFHRTVRNELGVDPKIPWWKPFASHRIRMRVNDDVLPLRVRRLRFRKYPDVLLEMPVKEGFPTGLALGKPGLLTAEAHATGDAAFDRRVHLEGPSAVWLSVLDPPLRQRLLTAVDERKLHLRRGRLHAEVHGLDLKSRGLEQVRAFVALAADLQAAAAGPLGERLLARARNDPDLLVRTHAARAFWSLGGSWDQATALIEDWLTAPEPILRITACEASPPEVALPVLVALAGDPSTPTAHAVLAVRRLGGLEHPDLVGALHGLANPQPDVVFAVAKELARHGEQGGGLALAEDGSGGELAVVGAEGGELAVAGGGALSKIEER